jgi:hypothetical protein
MGDYKYAIQILAEELASELYDKDYYELTEAVRSEVYAKANASFWEVHYGK